MTAPLSTSQPSGVPFPRPVLQVEDLVTTYRTSQGTVRAVDGVSFSLGEGEVLGLVGESGCGKSTLALSLLKLLPDNAAIERGHVYLHDVDLASLSEREIRRYRWRHIAMVFQAAMNSLDPMYPVGEQVSEAILNHERVSGIVVQERIAELFSMVGRYPHQFSGGMRQRAVIAMALSCDPQVLIADEPTTALDVIIQHHILQELAALQQRRNMAMLYISHDLGVIASISDRVAVMYGGKIVELAPAATLFQHPQHPYTSALMSALPSVRGPKRNPAAMPSEAPIYPPPDPGCWFAPRCPGATETCWVREPPLETRGDGHLSACWNPLEAARGGPNG